MLKLHHMRVVRLEKTTHLQIVGHSDNVWPIVSVRCTGNVCHNSAQLLVLELKRLELFLQLLEIRIDWKSLSPFARAAGGM